MFVRRSVACRSRGVTVMAMGSLNSSTQRQTGLLFSLPDELIEVIAFLLPFKDRLAFADTCTYCRGFVSDLDCSTRCTNAGLSLPNESSPRAMAKLLVQPRAGVCNWSDADGKPQAILERKKGAAVTRCLDNLDN